MTDFNFKSEDLVDTEEIARKLKEKMEDEIVESIAWKIRDQVYEKVIEHLTPEIDLIVKDSKDQVLQGVKDGLPVVAKVLAEKMVITATENLNGYSGKDVLKKLFG